MKKHLSNPTACLCAATLAACAPTQELGSSKTPTEETTASLITQYDQAFEDHTGLPLGEWLSTNPDFERLAETLSEVTVGTTSAWEFIKELNETENTTTEVGTPKTSEFGILRCSHKRAPGDRGQGASRPSAKEYNTLRGTETHPSFNHCVGNSMQTRSSSNIPATLIKTGSQQLLSLVATTGCAYVDACVRGNSNGFGLLLTDPYQRELYHLKWAYYLLPTGQGNNVRSNSIVCTALAHTVAGNMKTHMFGSIGNEKCFDVHSDEQTSTRLVNAISNLFSFQQGEINKVGKRLEQGGYQVGATGVQILEQAARNAPWYALGGALSILGKLGKLLQYTF